MKSLFRHTAAWSVLAALVFSQSGFALHVGYCIEYFQLDDGSTCSMTMIERNEVSALTDVAFQSSLSCCATKSIEANKRYVAFVKDLKPAEKLSLVLVVSPAIQNEVPASYRIVAVGECHSHSPPLSQLIIQSTILLI